MKTTKILAVLLALVLVISLAACTEPAEGNNGTTDTTNPVENNTTGTTPEAGDDTTDTTPVTGDDTADTTPVTGDNTTDTEADTEEIVPPAHPEQNIIDLADGVFEDPTFDDSTAVMFEQGDERVVEDGQLTITCKPNGSQTQCYVQCWTKQESLTPGVYKVYFKAHAVGGQLYWAQFCFGPGVDCKGAATIDGTDQVITVTHSNTGGNSLSFGAGGGSDVTAVVFDYIQVVPVYD